MADQPDSGARQREEVYRVFPERPISDRNLLSGRDVTINSCKDVVFRQGGGILLLYGDRGVGKTSLWRVLLHDHEHAVATAVPGISLPQIFLPILIKYDAIWVASKRTAEAGSEIESDIGASTPIITSKVSSKATAKSGQEKQPIEQRRLDSSFIVEGMKQIQKRVKYIVIEEIDRLDQEAVRDDLVRLIKALSDDTEITLSLVLVGSARAESELLSGKEYSLYQNRQLWHSVPVLPLTHQEVKDLLQSRERTLGIKFDGKAGDDLAWISSGYPYVANTLARFCCILWLTKNYRKVFSSDSGGFFGWVARIFTGKSRGEGAFSSFGVQITSEELEQAVASFSQSADAQSIQMYRRLVLKDDQDSADAIRMIQLVADSDEPLELTKIAEKTGFSEQRIKRLVQQYCSDAVSVDDQQKLDVPQQLRWYSRSVEYLTPSVAYP